MKTKTFVLWTMGDIETCNVWLYLPLFCLSRFALCSGLRRPFKAINAFFSYPLGANINSVLNTPKSAPDFPQQSPGREQNTATRSSPFTTDGGRQHRQHGFHCCCCCLFYVRMYEYSIERYEYIVYTGKSRAISYEGCVGCVIETF